MCYRCGSSCSSALRFGGLSATPWTSSWWWKPLLGSGSFVLRFSFTVHYYLKPSSCRRQDGASKKKNPKKTEKHPYSFSSMCKMLFCPFLSLLALSEELFDDTIIAAHVPLLSCQSSMFVSFFYEETKNTIHKKQTCNLCCESKSHDFLSSPPPQHHCPLPHDYVGSGCAAVCWRSGHALLPIHLWVRYFCVFPKINQNPLSVL